MATLHFANIKLRLRARIPLRALVQLLPARPDNLGDEFARQVHKSVIASGLGYYPPLAYLKSQNLVAPYLLEAVEQVAAASDQYLRSIINERLAPVFSNVVLISVQFPAFALPPIRLSDPDAIARLARHYIPYEIKCELSVSMIRKQPGEEGLDKFAISAFKRSLSELLDELDVTPLEAN